MHGQSRIAKIVSGAGLLMSLCMTNQVGLAREKYETIEAQAYGTGTQMGASIGVTLNIYEFSTPADKQILVQAYEKGANQGLEWTTKLRQANKTHFSANGELSYGSESTEVHAGV